MTGKLTTKLLCDPSQLVAKPLRLFQSYMEVLMLVKLKTCWLHLGGKLRFNLMA
jgi:hypothetical protein